MFSSNAPGWLAGIPVGLLVGMLFLLPASVGATVDEQAEVAIANLKLARVTEASRQFEAVLKQSPTHHRANFGAAVLAIKLERQEDAFKHLRVSYEADPLDADVGLSYSALLIDRGAYAEAQAVLMPLHKAEPRDARVVKNLAEAAIGVRDFAGSLALFKNYLTLVPNAPNRAAVERKMKLLEAKLRQP